MLSGNLNNAENYKAEKYFSVKKSVPFLFLMRIGELI